MNPNPPDNSFAPNLLAQVLAAAVRDAQKVSALDLFLRLQQLPGPLDDLLGDLCEHSYRVLVCEFLTLCDDRGLPPEPLRFQSWLMTNTELPGYLVTTFGERLDQDQKDGLALAPALNPAVCVRLAKLEEAYQVSVAAPPAVAVEEPEVSASEPLPPPDTLTAPKVADVELLAPGDAAVAAMIAANELVPPQPSE